MPLIDENRNSRHHANLQTSCISTPFALFIEPQPTRYCSRVTPDNRTEAASLLSAPVPQVSHPFQQVLGATSAPVQTPSDKADEASGKGRRRPVQSPEAAVYSADMLQWLKRVEHSLSNANLVHGVRKDIDTNPNCNDESPITALPIRADAHR